MVQSEENTNELSIYCVPHSAYIQLSELGTKIIVSSVWQCSHY